MVAPARSLLTRLGTLYEGDERPRQALETYARVFREGARRPGDGDDGAHRGGPALGPAGDLRRRAGGADRRRRGDRGAVRSRRRGSSTSGWATRRGRGSTTTARWFDPARRRCSPPSKPCSRGRTRTASCFRALPRGGRPLDDVEARKAYLFKIAAIDETALNDAPRGDRGLPGDPRGRPGRRARGRRLDARRPHRAVDRPPSCSSAASPTPCRATSVPNLRYRLGRLRVERLQATPGRRRRLPRDPGGAPRPLRRGVGPRADRRPPARAPASRWWRSSSRFTARPTTGGSWWPCSASGFAGVDRPGRPWRAPARDRVGSRTRAPTTSTAPSRPTARPSRATPGDGEAREAVERPRPSTRWGPPRPDLRDGSSRRPTTSRRAPTSQRRRADPRPAPRRPARGDRRLQPALHPRRQPARRPDLLENLHVLLSDWAGTSRCLSARWPAPDDEDRKRLHTIGDCSATCSATPRGHLGLPPPRSTRPGGRVRPRGPRRALHRRGRGGELAGVLSQRLSIEGDAEVRHETALRLGRLWEKDLNDPSRRSTPTAAAPTTRPPTRPPSRARAPLPAASSGTTSREPPPRRPPPPTTARAPLLLRLGESPGDAPATPAARSTWREVLAESMSERAIVSVRAPADNPRPARVGGGDLEPIFRNARWDDLACPEAKSAGVDDPPARLVGSSSAAPRR